MLSFLNDFVKTILCMGIGFGITFIGKHTNALGIFFVGILLIAFSPAYFLGYYRQAQCGAMSAGQWCELFCNAFVFHAVRL